MTTGQTLYFVTDIEADGPSPYENSMLSFATVVLSEGGVPLGEFEATLTPRPDRRADAGTTAWWQTQPEAWAAATAAPQDPATVMPRYADWVEGFDGRRIFAARPLLFDGLWMDTYLHGYAGTRALSVPRHVRPIFAGQGLCIVSFMSALQGKTAVGEASDPLPADWLGDHPHTHRAIDDARGYASLLARLLAMAAGRAGAAL